MTTLFTPTVRPNGWPVVPPWGDLSDHCVRGVVQMYDDEMWHALLLESSSGHRWHLVINGDTACASSAGWRDVDGKNMLPKAALVPPPAEVMA